MKLITWAEPPAEAVAAVFAEALPTPILTTGTRREAVAALHTGQADVALVPILEALRDPDAFQFLPGLGLATWAYPYAKLVLKTDLAQLAPVGFDPAHAQAVLLARILLREHYGANPTFMPFPADTPLATIFEQASVALQVAPIFPTETPTFQALDLGQEWYELTAAPLVHGLWAVPAGQGTPELAEHLYTAFKETAPAFTDFPANSEEERTYLQTQVTGLLDDTALQGMETLIDYFYFYNVIDEMPDLPFIPFPEKETE